MESSLILEHWPKTKVTHLIGRRRRRPAPPALSGADLLVLLLALAGLEQHQPVVLVLVVVVRAGAELLGVQVGGALQRRRRVRHHQLHLRPSFVFVYKTNKAPANE